MAGKLSGKRIAILATDGVLLERGEPGDQLVAVARRVVPVVPGVLVAGGIPELDGEGPPAARLVGQRHGAHAGGKRPAREGVVGAAHAFSPSGTW